MKTERVKAPKVKAFLVKVANHDHWALPADAEGYERMVEQIKRHWMTYPCGPTTTNLAQNALRAIGIVPPRTGKGRK